MDNTIIPLLLELTWKDKIANRQVKHRVEHTEYNTLSREESSRKEKAGDQAGWGGDELFIGMVREGLTEKVTCGPGAETQEVPSEGTHVPKTRCLLPLPS